MGRIRHGGCFIVFMMTAATLISVVMSLMPVPPKRATPRCTGPKDKGAHGTCCQPIGISIIRPSTIIANTIAVDPPEDHIACECDDGNEEGKGGENRHEDGANTVIGKCATEAKDYSEK